uniref:Uncharacterized protein n=1 Tax=Arundo donax TaxID=35708 RepID=A0A0A9DWS1_ARUDO
MTVADFSPTPIAPKRAWVDNIARMYVESPCKVSQVWNGT